MLVLAVLDLPLPEELAGHVLHRAALLSLAAHPVLPLVLLVARDLLLVCVRHLEHHLPEEQLLRLLPMQTSLLTGLDLLR